MSTPDERRKNTRVSFEALIDLSCGEKFFPQCATKNLSTKGVLIAGITGLELQDECDIILYLSGGSDITLTMKGVIRRITDAGVGIHFTETDLDSFTHLKNIIYYNSENPDIINETY
jgi:hypothetical protein